MGFQHGRRPRGSSRYRPVRGTGPAQPARPWNDPSWTPPSDAFDDGPVSEVSLSPDYLCELPLWGCNWWDLHLSPGLLNALADWQANFDAGYDPKTGWRDDQTRESWKKEAARLTERLRYALPNVEVHVDLWPLDAR